MAREHVDRAATVDRLVALGAAGGLGDAALGRALELASESPRPAEWRAFLARALLWAGALLVLAGVITFFAFNWRDLPGLAKLALLELAVAGAAIGAWQSGRRAAGEASLAAAAVLVGPLLAVYGQTYQTGADPYELFAGWAVLILPWVALARTPSLWLLELALWQVALPLFVDQRLGFEDDLEELIPPILGAVNAAAWQVAETLWRRGRRELAPRWAVRVVALAAFLAALPGAVSLVLGARHHTVLGWTSLALLVGLTAAAWVLSRRPERRDLFLLAIAGASVLLVAGCAAGRTIFKEMDLEIGGVLLLGLVVLAEVGGLVTWLRRMGSAEVDEG